MASNVTKATKQSGSVIECKVVLLGKEAVGKTCISERFVNERFPNVNDTQSTVGVVFNAKCLVVNNRTVRISLWDTAGSERFTSISRLYYRNAKAAIVCYDLTDPTSLDKCLFWIGELQKTEEQCQIYLVGTKFDVVEQNVRNRKVSPSDVEKIAKEVGAIIFETSSRTGKGIFELFTTIAVNFVNSLPPGDLVQNELSSINESFQISSANTDPPQRIVKKTKRCC